MKSTTSYRMIAAFSAACLLCVGVGIYLAWSKPGGTPLQPTRTSCSSINLVNDGYSIFGKNLDNSYTTDGLILINKRGVERASPYLSTTGQRAEWISKYASVNFCFVHVGLVWTGMNEKGLVISMMGGIPHTEGPPPDHRPPLVDGQWIQYMLDNYETVEQVLAAADQVRIITIDHYHVADRTGNSAVLEFLRGEKYVYTGDTLPVSALTNSTYESSVRDWNRSRGTSTPPPDGSLERFRIAGEWLEQFTTTDKEAVIDYAFATLSSIRSELIYRYPATTQWSFVFDTESRRAYFKTYTHPEIRYFDLHDFHLQCDTPVQMLDIQSVLFGEVSSYFEDITHEAAYEHYRQFVESWFGYTPSESHVIQEINFYMSFPCSGAAAPRRPGGRTSAH